MAEQWPSISYGAWRETCDTLHAHTQVLGKLAAELAPPEPQLQHAALRLTARGWETPPLPAPNGSGAFVVLLELHRHEAAVEVSNGERRAVPLTPDRPAGEVTRELLAAVAELAGPVEIDPTPQEVPWSQPLDEDEEHARYDADQVADYFGAATRAAQVLAAYRAPFRGRSTPVNAWWGSFDLAVSLFSGDPAAPPSGDFIMRNAMDAQGGRRRLVAGRRQIRQGRLLRLRPPGTRELRRRPALAATVALGWRARRVPARLGGRRRRRRPAAPGARVRPLGLPALLPHLWLGP